MIKNVFTMEIQKIFSDQYDEERYYSVLITEEEMKLFATLRYDMTDQYKQMKDSDILAEKKKSNVGSYLNAGKIAAVGAGIGATILGAKRGFKGGNVWKGMKKGAALGGLVGGGIGLATTHGQRADNRFANDRLEAAQRQALRREKKDWRNNTTNREGYTY